MHSKITYNNNLPHGLQLPRNEGTSSRVDVKVAHRSIKHALAKERRKEEITTWVNQDKVKYISLETSRHDTKCLARLRRRFSFVLQQALSFRTRHHLCRQAVALTRSHRVRSQDTSLEKKNTDRNRPQGREGEAADGTGERRVGGTEPAIDRFEIVYLRESGTTTDNQHSHLRVSTPARARCNSRGDKTQSLERRGNGERRGSGVMWENRPCKDRD